RPRVWCDHRSPSHVFHTDRVGRHESLPEDPAAGRQLDAKHVEAGGARRLEVLNEIEEPAVVAPLNGDVSGRERGKGLAISTIDGIEHPSITGPAKNRVFVAGGGLAGQKHT